MKAPHHALHHRHTTHAVGKAATPAKPGGGGTSATGGKGTATHKHHHAAHHKHQPKKARKWTIDGDIALCSARAVGELVGLDDDAVLGLFWQAGGDPDNGVPVLDVLEAARRLGYLESFNTATVDADIVCISWPQPHAVAVDPSGNWWSWGERFQPWAPVDEAWSVTWR